MLVGLTKIAAVDAQSQVLEVVFQIIVSITQEQESAAALVFAKIVALHTTHL